MQTTPQQSAQFASPNMHISDEDFRNTAALVRRHFGIHLPESKKGMLGARLFKLVRARGCNSFSEFYKKHLVNPSPETLSLLADNLSTNHTFFNRESEHFWSLRDRYMPELVRSIRRSGQLDFRMWCAASSSGEEPYTLAMVIQDVLGSEASRWTSGLLATDISNNALRKARAGVYPTDAVRTLPAAYHTRWFRDLGNGKSEVVPELKAEVTYRRFNLMNQQLPFKRAFHVVFCRNVMIYFEEDTKRELVERIYRHTAPGGYLFIGHAESINGLGTRFRTVQPGVYRKDG